MSKRQNINLGGGKLIGLLLAVAFLLTANARADFAQFGSVDAASDAGMVELFTITFTGNSTAVNGGSNEILWEPVGISFSSAVLERGVSTDGWFRAGQWNGYKFEVDLADIDGFVVSAYTFSNSSADENDVAKRDDWTYVSFDEGLLTGGIGTWSTYNTITGAPVINRAINVTIGVWGYAAEPVAAPEPATLAVLGLGLVGLGIARRRMKK